MTLQCSLDAVFYLIEYAGQFGLCIPWPEGKLGMRLLYAEVLIA